MATIKDVASLSGLSIATVSKFINSKCIKKENEEKIQSAIEQLNYRQNSIGKHLRIGKTMTIGVIINTLQSSFVNMTCSVLEQRLGKVGYNVIFSTTHGSRELERKKLDYFTNGTVDGILLFPTHDDAEIPDIDVPVVIADNAQTTGSFPTVTFDDEAASFQATKYLVENGHQRIGCIAGYANHHATRARTEGYRRALIDGGIGFDEKLIIYAEFCNTNSEQGTLALLHQTNPPTAFLVISSDMLSGFFLGVKRAGKRVCEDVSYITFDSKDYFDLLSHRPTYVNQPKNAFGDALFETIIEAIDAKERANLGKTIYIETTLSIGDSVRDLRGNRELTDF